MARFNPFDARLRVETARFFVDIDEGYITYGRRGEGESTERLAHFGDRAEWPTLSALREFAEEFVCSLPSLVAEM